MAAFECNEYRQMWMSRWRTWACLHETWPRRVSLLVEWTRQTKVFVSVELIRSNSSFRILRVYHVTDAWGQKHPFPLVFTVSIMIPTTERKVEGWSSRSPSWSAVRSSIGDPCHLTPKLTHAPFINSAAVYLVEPWSPTDNATLELMLFCVLNWLRFYLS